MIKRAKSHKRKGNKGAIGHNPLRFGRRTADNHQLVFKRQKPKRKAGCGEKEWVTAD